MLGVPFAWSTSILLQPCLFAANSLAFRLDAMEVRRQELQCKKDCIKSPLLMKFLAPA